MSMFRFPGFKRFTYHQQGLFHEIPMSRILRHDGVTLELHSQFEFFIFLYMLDQYKLTPVIGENSHGYEGSEGVGE